MSIRVAVATGADGETPAHFGKAEGFVIAEVEKEESRIVEFRANDPACEGQGGHSEGRLADAIERIADCQYLFVVNVGLVVEANLAKRGIRCLPVLETVEKTLDRLSRSPLLNRPEAVIAE